jgi:hypothetical protein
VRIKGRMPKDGSFAVDSQVSPNRKSSRPICRMAGMPDRIRYTVISRTQPTVTSPKRRKIPWISFSIKR